MSQNIDQFLKYFIFEGTQSLTKILNLKQLQFASPRLIKRQQSNPYELNELNKKSKLISEKAFDIVSEFYILLKQCKFENVSTKIIFNYMLSLQLKRNYIDCLQLNTTDKNYVICVDIIQEYKEQIIRQMYSFVNWVVLYQKGQTTYGEFKTEYEDYAHIQIFENQNKLILVIGYNKIESELFLSINLVRNQNYMRNNLSLLNIPEYRQDTFCSILYHFISIIRKMLRFSDTKRYDSELRQLISANASMLIEHPEKQKHIPFLGSFNHCDFVLFDFKISNQQEFDKRLKNFQYQKELIMSIIGNLKTLYVRSQDDMSYCFVLSGQYLLVTFQYKIDGAILLKEVEQRNILIRECYEFVEKDFEYGIKKIIITNQEKNQKKEENQKSQRNQKIADLITTSVNTAFSWYDYAKSVNLINKQQQYANKSLTPRRQ
ncbi:unnamed protein product [Paramecium sonneborni]|uniref:Uncharacterized protein n=1 Tax=Paramecium sonneborni TaxID=65129 RepID=A0A8S1PS29_9CILI|nr:unnamed protein product [Paramecium sonneborni]